VAEGVEGEEAAVGEG